MREPPSLPALFAVFLSIGIQSFGGGLSAWMRREVVQRHGWLEDPQFLSGLALSQIAPGPNAVNLAVFIGTTLRGGRGALAALGGLMLLPAALALGAGALYLSHQSLPGLQAALTGLGAAAIGLNLATGVRLTRRNVRSVRAAFVMAGTAVAIGVMGLPLLWVLAGMVPLSLLLLGRKRR